MKCELDIERLKDLFEYRDGNIFWKVKKSKTTNVGDKAGWIDNGYNRVSIDNKNILVHRVIFAMHYGYLPEFIDHKDGDSLNNRIENLREATRQQNQHNSKLPVTNTSGVKGVCWKKTSNAWVVQIENGGKKIHIGIFKDFELAKLIAEEARDKYHGDFARYY